MQSPPINKYLVEMSTWLPWQLEGWIRQSNSGGYWIDDDDESDKAIKKKVTLSYSNQMFNLVWHQFWVKRGDKPHGITCKEWSTRKIRKKSDILMVLL